MERVDEQQSASKQKQETCDADRVYECSECGEHYEASPFSRIQCPECGTERHRCLGTVEEACA